MKRICVYCGSNSGTSPEYLNAATNLGQCLSERGIGVVYGGSDLGLMGAVANSALNNGGEVIGLSPRYLPNWSNTTGSANFTLFRPCMNGRK